MTEDKSKTRVVQGVDSPDGLRNLTRVTESQIKRTGSNPEPQTAKPVNFSPPGQGPAASAPATPAQTTSGAGSDNQSG
jgi:hypothetical protein